MTTTTEKTWEKLVRAKKPCLQSYSSYPSEDIALPHTIECRCHGTGKELVLPDLSEECRNSETIYLPNVRGWHTKECCNGTGRVPKPMHLETLLEASVAAGEGGIAQEAVSALRNDKPILETAVEAAWEAVQARYPQEEKA